METDRLVERTISSMQPGEHTCCICTGEAQCRAVFARFVSAGLNAGQKVLYLYHSIAPEALVASLREAGLDPDPALRGGQLAFQACREVFGPPERFDAPPALAALRALADQAVYAGYPAIRLGIEMSWAARFLCGSPGAARLLDLEASFNDPGALPSQITLCVYDRELFSAGLLAEVLPLHPTTADGNILARNSGYLPPAAYQARQRRKARFAPPVQALPAQSDPAEAPRSSLAGWGKRAQKKIESLAEAQAALQESGKRYKTIFDFATDAIFIHDLDGHIMEVNSMACQRLSYTPGELIGRTPDFLDAPELAGQVPLRLNLLQRYGAISFETVHVSRLGEMIPVEVNARLIHYAGRPAVLSFARDITDRKRAEMAQLNANQALATANEALETANQALEAANAALSASEQKFRRVVETSPDGILLADEQGSLIEFNPANETIYGVSAAQVLGKSLADFYYDSELPELRLEYRFAAIRRAVTEALAAGKADWLERINEREILRFDGHRRFLQSIGFPIPTERGYMIGVITRDVTDDRRIELELEQYRQRLEVMVAERTAQLEHEIRERQQAEENLEVMLREIHHRVKNNLNVIIALIDLQKSAHSDPQVLQVFKDLQTRAYTMALVHESLYRSPNLALVDFSGYLRTLVAYLNTAYGSPGVGMPVRVRVEAENIPLKIETAIPCGLIVNELVTNALKYAFPAGRDIPDAEITVALASVGDGAGYVLTVRDNGVGFLPGANWASMDSLGLQLVQVLTRQIGGRVSLDTAGGAAWRLEFSERRG